VRGDPAACIGGGSAISNRATAVFVRRALIVDTSTALPSAWHADARGWVGKL